MDLDQVERTFTWGAIVLLLIAAVTALGELFGWWNDTGEVVLTITTVLGGLLGVVAFLLNATKGQVRQVADGVIENGSKLDVLHEDLEGLRGQVGPLNERVSMLNEGMSHLNGGMSDLNGGMSELNGGMSELNGGMSGLNEGMADVRRLLREVRDRL